MKKGLVIAAGAVTFGCFGGWFESTVDAVSKTADLVNKVDSAVKSVSTATQQLSSATNATSSATATSASATATTATATAAKSTDTAALVAEWQQKIRTACQNGEISVRASRELSRELGKGVRQITDEASALQFSSNMCARLEAKKAEQRK